MYLLELRTKILNVKKVIKVYSEHNIFKSLLETMPIPCQCQCVFLLCAVCNKITTESSIWTSQHLNEFRIEKMLVHDAEKSLDSCYTFRMKKKFRVFLVICIFLAHFEDLKDLKDAFVDLTPNNILARIKELPTARREYYLVRRSSLNIILTQKSFFFVYVRKYIYMDADKSRKNIGIFVMFFGYTMVLLCLPSCLLFAWMWKVKYSFRWQKDFNLLDRTRTWIRVVIWLWYGFTSSFVWHKVPSIL